LAHLVRNATGKCTLSPPCGQSSRLSEFMDAAAADAIIGQTSNACIIKQTRRGRFVWGVSASRIAPGEAAKSVASFVFGLSCEALALAIAWWAYTFDLAKSRLTCTADQDAPPGHLVGFTTLALWGGTCVN